MRVACIFSVSALVWLTPALAVADGEAPAVEASTVTEARSLYEKGTELGQKAQWAEALASFERSFKLRPHAATLYNVAQCFRAMGQYARARAKFVEGLTWSREHGDELPESLATSSRGYVAEIERLLSRVEITLAPADAKLAVDGAPLVNDGGAWVAGVASPGAPATAPGARFVITVDPGTRIFTLARQGFQDVVVRETFAPGGSTKLDLQLDRLPARLNISANRPNALAFVNDVDAGTVPVSLRRAAGKYHVRVTEAGFVPYDTEVTVRAGEEANLRAPLEPEKIPITKRWWFWTAAGVVLTGVVVTTYLVTRPEPDRQPLDGGGLGWIVPVP